MRGAPAATGAPFDNGKSPWFSRRYADA